MRVSAYGLGVLLGLTACGPDVDLEEDFVEQPVESGCAPSASVIAFLNDDALTLSVLDDDVGLDRRAASAIFDFRAGSDDQVGTSDDASFASLDDVDALPYVGPSALSRLTSFALANRCENAQHPGANVRYSQQVLDDVLATYGLDDEDALLARALSYDNGNGYLNRAELSAAAQALLIDLNTVSGFGWSDSVLEEVLSDYGLYDAYALLAISTTFDSDLNQYLNRHELAAGGRALTGETVEIGIISDIDRTILPPSSSGSPLPAPYPGVTTLYNELETGNNGEAGDVYYVTARDAASAQGLDDWMDTYGLPAGPIETGIAPEPWIAEPEKISDISEIMHSMPDQEFVLFGDSNHRDPEVYRAIMDAFDSRVSAVFIHKVRIPAASRVVDMNLITNYAEAAAILFGQEIISQSAARRIMVAAQNEGLPLTDVDIDRLINLHR